MTDTGMEDDRPRQRQLSPEERASLRRQAVQLAGMLPEDTLSALYVLASARSLILDFLDRDRADQGVPLRLVASDD